MGKTDKRSSDGYSWRFFRAGGFDQVRLNSANDLLALEHLDQKLWVALACPVDNVHFDRRTLSLLDTNGDGRVRAPELIAAIKWALPLLKNPDEILSAPGMLFLHAIQDATDEGKAIAAALRNALSALGKPETDPITVADTESLEKVLAQKAFNGDGIITEQASTDETLRSVIRDIAAQGAAKDRSGDAGVSGEMVEAYFTQAREYCAWIAESESNSAIRPLDDSTEEAANVIAAAREKIDDFFARCSIARFDGRAAASLNAGEKEFGAIAGKPLSTKCAEIANLPLAQITPDGDLPLDHVLNPAWIETIKRIERTAIRPLLGQKAKLSESDWLELQATFEPWFSWQARKPATPFDSLGIDKTRTLLNGAAKTALMELIEKDKAETATFASLLALEKLVRFHRDLATLCANFVNFKDFYAKKGMAILQAGTLYLDQRSCRLCIKVDDVNKHCVMAAMAGAYLVYCDCRRRSGTERMNIVAAFTNGDSENLIVGRNGIFYDRSGNDWDACIAKIIENPISLRQAFWLPYKSFVRMIESQVAKRASAADAQSTATLQQAAVSTANPEQVKVTQPPKKLDIGIVAALGVAAGALGTFIATVMGYTASIIRLGPLAIIGALAGLMLLISGPSLVLAYIKLRKRNLGPILDASGWAVNAKARISVPFGTVLTQVATLPPGAQRDLTDPYAEKKSPWPKVAVLALLIYLAYATLNHFGFINKWSGGFIGLKREGLAKSAAIDRSTTKATTLPRP
jgi:hypothetical protein